MDNINEIVFMFKEHLKKLNRSKATIDSYCTHAYLLLAALKCEDIRQVTKMMLENHIAKLFAWRNEQNKGYSVGTICIKVRAIKRLFEFLENMNIVFINPAESIKEPQKNKNPIRPALNARQMQLLLDQPNLALMTGIRDRAILEVFYSTGVRLGELCALTVFDADLQGALLRINCGKGAKDRVRDACRMPRCSPIHR